jgi:alkylation response protein AidB-like acyl-CoA dehydrogenase
MTDKLVNLRDIRFVLHELLRVDKLLDSEAFSMHSRETFEMALDGAYKLAREVYWPAYRQMDQVGARFDPTTKKVAVPPVMHGVWAAAKEGGWFGVTSDAEFGGQQFPGTVGLAVNFMLNAANTAAQMYVGGAHGASILMEAFGDETMKTVYVPRLLAGEWGGTMALSEPQAGSSLSDVKTTAVKAKDGDEYLITGTKCFISSGDHDLSENIIHPVLARLPGAPAGVKGISLFIVPKYRVRADGSVGQFNDVVTGGIEHKLGLRGQATATLNFGENGDCRGRLMGEPNKGLAYMFRLMNGARIGTGVQATAVASNAYQHALQYAKDRLQGRDIAEKDPTTPQVPIIRHPDVRRMLLAQKAWTEGMFALLAYSANLIDRERVAGSDEERERFRDILEILTPVCKAYGSEISYQSTILAIQVYGGYGFSEEFPLAQMLRDQKVFSIYEGTNNIQAMDLLGRKVVIKNGASFKALVGEIVKTTREAGGVPALKEMAGKVDAALQTVVETTQHLALIGFSDPQAYMSQASPYLQMFSQLVVAWQLLWEALVAQKALDSGTSEEAFYRGKLAAAQFYVNNDLAQAQATAAVIRSGDRTALDCREAWL